MNDLNLAQAQGTAGLLLGIAGPIIGAIIKLISDIEASAAMDAQQKAAETARLRGVLDGWLAVLQSDPVWKPGPTTPTPTPTP